MKKFVAILTLALFVLPVSLAENSVDVEIFNAVNEKVKEIKISYEDAKRIEEGDLSPLRIKHDSGFSNYIISCGGGKVFIPFSKERSFLRLMLRPILFHYSKGITITKFGANYVWKGKSIDDYGLMIGNQFGIMLGFVGLHIKIGWKLREDTHIFVGSSILFIGYDKLG
ncbi:MAG: hypothetical protein H5T44_01920 [Thermoplasmatales archaeon]|nr:hypothetical protein [Thermoplasmatales archaeon]